MINNNFGGNEIIHVVDAVSKEKGLEKEAIFKVIEKAMGTTAKIKYGNEVCIKTKIDRSSGNISFFREFLVTDKNPEDPEEEGEIETLTLEEAKEKSTDLKEGDIYTESLPPLERERHIAAKARQLMTASIYELVKEKLFEEYSDRVGEIVAGIVEKIDKTGYIIKIANNAEAILRKDQVLNTDILKLGDRVKAQLVKLNKESFGPMIILSRTHKDFVRNLFIQEVPEIYEKQITIQDIARDPGSRTKISVFSTDPAIDPVGACVGMRGIRVQQVIQELKGEKIDIIKWSENPGTYVVNALDSLDVVKVIVDEDQKAIEVIVNDEGLSKAIGRRGQNVKLISELTGYKIDIMAESNEMEKRQKEFARVSQIFQEELHLEEILAQLLVSEGYDSIQALAKAEPKIVGNIEGIDEEIGEAIVSRAKEALDNTDDTSETAQETEATAEDSLEDAQTEEQTE
jgi:N utilization substance protein A